MAHPQYIDISGWQEPSSIDWQAYKQWSASVDGVSRVAIKVNEGTAGIDAHCHQHWLNALEAGIDQIILYHYARPDLNANAGDEVASYLYQIGSGLRKNDLLMLDYEKMPESAVWALEWLKNISSKFAPERCAIYANRNAVLTHLQDSSLAAFPLILAQWTYDANDIPSAPLPWTSMLALQYSNKQNVPGVSGAVDADVFLHAPNVAPPVPPIVDIVKIRAGLNQIIADAQAALKLLP